MLLVRKKNPSDRMDGIVITPLGDHRYQYGTTIYHVHTEGDTMIVLADGKQTTVKREENQFTIDGVRYTIPPSQLNGGKVTFTVTPAVPVVPAASEASEAPAAPAASAASDASAVPAASAASAASDASAVPAASDASAVPAASEASEVPAVPAASEASAVPAASAVEPAVEPAAPAASEVPAASAAPAIPAASAAPVVPAAPAHIVPHNNPKNWFTDYFDEREEDIIKRLQPSDYTSKSVELYNIEPKIDKKDIRVTIGNTQYEVGDFSCLSYKDIKAKTGTVLPSDRLTYEYKKGDISEICNEIKQDDMVVVQAASQFNLLEMGNESITPEKGITIYAMDNTQGPRVALSSPAATFFRNYFIFNGKPQISGTQINTLDTLLNNEKIKDWIHPIGEGSIYQNGYYFPRLKGEKPIAIDGIQDIMDENLKVGIHWNAPSITNPVIRLCQVYCSGLPIRNILAMKGRTKAEQDKYKKRIAPFATALLTSAYKCTLQAAVHKLNAYNPGNKTHRCTVYLTAVGGGAFGNDMQWIQEAVTAALAEFEAYPLDVKMIWYGKEDNELQASVVQPPASSAALDTALAPSSATSSAALSTVASTSSTAASTSSTASDVASAASSTLSAPSSTASTVSTSSIASDVASTASSTLSTASTSRIPRKPAARPSARPAPAAPRQKGGRHTTQKRYKLRSHKRM